MLRFTRELIALRRRHPCLTANRFLDGEPVPRRGIPDIAWHGARLASRRGTPALPFLAFTLAGLASDEEDLHVLLNMSDQAVDAALPSIPGRRWHVALDTSRCRRQDIVARGQQRRIRGAATRRMRAAWSCWKRGQPTATADARRRWRHRRRSACRREARADGRSGPRRGVGAPNRRAHIARSATGWDRFPLVRGVPRAP